VKKGQHDGVIAIIVAGGRGIRLGLDLPKPLARLGGQPMVSYSLQTFERFPGVDNIILVCGADWLEEAQTLAKRWGPKKCFAVVPGGEERPDSVRAGLSCLPDSCTQVAIHDGARPFVKPPLIHAALEALKTHHGSVPGLPLADTLRKREGSLSLGATDRTGYVLTQTPQCFRREVLETALRRAHEEGFSGTDDAAYVERLPGARIAIVPGDPDNFKITTPEDLIRAKRMVARKREANYRVGEGFDAHRLVEGRPLILGGVTFPFDKGLLGHSDADVLCHAIGDALLGAAALSDLGVHFPDSDPAYEGISSLTLLEKIGGMLSARDFEIANVDATLILEKPRIALHRQEMIAKIARALKTSEERISVKATTTEGMGFEGRGEGISCRATALLKSI